MSRKFTKRDDMVYMRDTLIRLRRRGKTLREIAERFSISRQYVFQIVGKTGRVKPPCASRNTILGSYKRMAKARGLVWRLTDSHFDELTSATCFYCGTPPMNICRAAGGLRAAFKYSGIDRKNNEAGYTTKNTVSCCRVCNRAKGNMSYKDFILWLDKIKHFR